MKMIFEVEATVKGIKVAVSQDFLTFFILWIQPTWVPDKQAKMGLLKNSLSRRYSNVDSSKELTPRSVSMRRVNFFYKLAN